MVVSIIYGFITTGGYIKFGTCVGYLSARRTVETYDAGVGIYNKGICVHRRLYFSCMSASFFIKFAQVLNYFSNESKSSSLIQILFFLINLIISLKFSLINLLFIAS